MAKILKIAVPVLSLGLATVASMYWLLVALTVPNYNQVLLVSDYPYIKNNVHIHRDEFGIPHIKA